MQASWQMMAFLSMLVFAFYPGVDAVRHASSAVSSGPNPMQKVITLLNKLKAQVEADGTAEASSYDTFSCKCKDDTNQKATDISTSKATIEGLSADLDSAAAELERQTNVKASKTKDSEALAREIADATDTWEKQKANLDADIAELARAIKALQDATTSLKGAKDQISLVALARSIAHRLALVSERRRDEPVARGKYNFQSDSIMDTLSSLEDDCTAKKDGLVKELGKMRSAFEADYAPVGGARVDELSSVNQAVKDAQGEMDAQETALGSARANMVDERATLEDLKLYLTELTKRCQVRAKDWDQRATSRADELEALQKAIEILVRGSKQNYDENVKRASLIALKPGEAVPSKKILVRTPSLFQQSAVEVSSKRARVATTRDASSADEVARARNVVALLRREGGRLGSTMLSGLAAQVSRDPFGKVKKLIQDLIERLLAESKNEVSKKGFCDTETAKAELQRDTEFEKANALNAEIAALEAKGKKLENSIATLESEIQALNTDYNETKHDRKVDKETNLATLNGLAEGLGALNEAIAVLTEYYKARGEGKAQATADAHGETQEFVESTQLGDTDAGAVKGAYNGRQELATGVFALLDVIKSDFERSTKQTTEAEKAAAAAFVEFERSTLSEIEGKETNKKNDEADLAITQEAIATGMSDLTTAMDLLDSGLKALVALKPMCVDTGMSYADRVARREEEKAALCKALQELGEEVPYNGCDGAVTGGGR